MIWPPACNSNPRPKSISLPYESRPMLGVSDCAATPYPDNRGPRPTLPFCLSGTAVRQQRACHRALAGQAGRGWTGCRRFLAAVARFAVPVCDRASCWTAGSLAGKALGIVIGFAAFFFRRRLGRLARRHSHDQARQCDDVRQCRELRLCGLGPVAGPQLAIAGAVGHRYSLPRSARRC